VELPVPSLTVVNLNDSGPGSLREAILSANVCPGSNTIVFAPSAYGKITLTSGELPITTPLSILGPGPTNVTISGNAASRVFYIGPNLNVTIAGLTIADGTNLFGGGIHNDHSILTVSNCTLSGNSAYFGGGGGIYNDGEGGNATLSVSACTFSRNSAYGVGGGGIYNDGEGGNATLNVLNSTISGNSAYFGGGVYNDGYSGSAALSVNACTFSGNSTVSDGLGGGIYSDDVLGVATVQIGDTILSAGASGANLQYGTITSLGYNLSSDNGGGFLTATTDQINTDPKLGPLQNNGGPTFTHALLPGSPAIDKGKRDAIPSLAANTDQRGFARPVDLACIANALGGDGSDIGAVELPVPSLTVVNLNDSGPGSLREAILSANVCPGSNTIVFAPSVYGKITLTSGQLSITTPLSILGPGPTNVVISGNAASRVFYVSPNLNITIAGLTIVDGVNAINGGGIYNDHSILTLSNCTLSGNSAFDGGGIYNDGNSGNATLSLSGCTFSRNSTRFRGGGVYNNGEAGNATLKVLNTTFSTNSATYGGGIYNDGFHGGAALSVNASTFSGNSAISVGGGAIHNIGLSGTSTVQIGDTILSAGASGATLQNEGGTVTSLGYNLSSDNGGGFLTATADQINTDPKLGPLQDNGGPTFTHVLSLDSPALDKGKNLAGSATDQRGLARIVDLCAANALGGDGSDIGAVELSVTIPSGTLTVLNTNDSGAGSLREAIMFANICPDANTIVFAPSAYGKITLTSGELPIAATLSIFGPGPTNVLISGNAASRVFYVAPNLNSTIAGLTIADGTNLFGGGIHNDHSILTVSNCTLSGNAAYFGGGIYNNGESGSATLYVSACTFSRNSANGDWGGGIYSDGEGGNATLKLLNSTFSTNSAGSGGAVYNDGFYGSAALSVNACTFSGNSTVFSGLGGGIYNDDGNGVATLQIGDTILSAGASGANLQYGTITSLGYNLSSDNGGGFLTATADQINTDPKLGPLQNNGGPTFTHALLPGSPAIDKGKRDAIPSLAANTDQRGLPRTMHVPGITNAPGGDGSDIGAFEVQLAATVGTPMLLVGPQKPLNGSFQFSFTNTPGASFSVLTTTNIALPLSNWTVLGTPREISPGYFQYADPQATNQPQRFYGVRSP
jgi:hypothetical protein